jgi:release factor glutamine methyltransferase
VNPPYVPTPPTAERTAWCDGGGDGRLLIDRVCAGARSVLREGGALWLVQSSLADIELTLTMLGMRGFKAEIVAERELELGPVSRARIDHLVAGGHAVAGESTERLAVVSATRLPL